MIKRIIKKFTKKNESTQYTESSFIKYKSSGNLIYGNNCKLDELNIIIYNSKNGFTNIEIGDDCYISGNIGIYSQTAKIVIGDGVFIGPNTTLFCYDNIVFQNDIMVSSGCTFIDTNAHSLNSAERKDDVRDWIKGPENKNWSVVKCAPILIEDKTWIGFNSIITKGVTLKEGTIIACGSVVQKSTERYSIYGGNPATFIKKTT